MLFFAEERGLRKEEDNLEEKEFVFVDVVVANIVISVFPSCCEEMLFFVQGPISVDVVFLLRVLPLSVSSSSFSFCLSALFPFFFRKANKFRSSVKKKTKESKLLSRHFARVIRLCKDLLRFELPLL